MKRLKAIAAMSLNRVIGAQGKIPWHLPDDFKWFKKMTRGNAVLMGRKTFQSLGRPLPDRTNIVLTRRGPIAGVETIASLDQFRPEKYGCDVFVIGGAELYAQLLPSCSELFLTVVFREVAGDVLFPLFEDEFALAEVLQRTPEFEIRRYINHRIR